MASKNKSESPQGLEFPRSPSEPTAASSHAGLSVPRAASAASKSADAISPPAAVQAAKTRTPAPADPLTPEQAKQLLAPVDIIRDPLHGDIRLTGLERFLIDTPEFQRLRGINQLAMTYIAFPGAVHTRFLHSLGVLHVCSRMIDTCNENADIYGSLASPTDAVPVRFTPYAELLARLCALLHDLAHVPFGHTFEKEGRLFEQDEWRDPDRRETRLLGPNTRLSKALRGYFEDHGLPAPAADGLRDDIKRILMAKNEEILELRYPFVHDIVGNTICADLIDYVQRDMYFCGLDERFSLRFLQYLAVMPFKRDSKTESYHPFRREGETFARAEQAVGSVTMCRIVLLRYRYNERRAPIKKYDVVEDAIDLVRRRLSVAEKLYFHRTKVVASAMLISAAFEHQLTAADIWDLNDGEVVKLLMASQSERARRLATATHERRLFKAIYRACYRPQDDESPDAIRLWGDGGVYAQFTGPKYREEFARRLEVVLGREIGDAARAVGSVTISCPDHRMNVKQFDMLVLPQPNHTARRLQVSTFNPTETAIHAIQSRHRHLWKLEVFVDPSVVQPCSELARKLAGTIAFEIGLPNELDDYERVDQHSLADWEQLVDVDEALEKVQPGLKTKIQRGHHRELLKVLQASYRAAPDAKQGMAASVREFVASKGYEV